MADDKTPSDVLSDLVNVPFPNAAYLESMKRVISVQKQMLDGFQSNLDKWFERRCEGAEATMSMFAELNGSTDHDQRAKPGSAGCPGPWPGSWTTCRPITT